MAVSVGLMMLRTRFELWLLGYHWTRRIILGAGVSHGNSMPELIDLAECRAIGQIVNAIGGRFRAGGVVRSLTAQRLLARRGVTTEVRIGVLHDVNANQFTTRTWLERSGEVINDDPDVVRDFRVVDDIRTPFH